MGIFEYEGKEYRYKDTVPWGEWKKLMESQMFPDVIKWYRDHVFIDVPKNLKAGAEMFKYVNSKLNPGKKVMKQILRSAGKLVRGIKVPQYQAKSVEFALMYHLGLSYTEIQNMSKDDVIFFNAMLAEVLRLGGSKFGK